MDVDAELIAECTPSELFGHVAELDRYPQWIDLVHRAEPVDVADGEDLAWSTELRARLGPFARSKQLRMVRTDFDAERRRVTFERRELDGREHSPWVLRADVDDHAQGAVLRMRLHYGGGLWTGGILERALLEQINEARGRLAALVAPNS